MSEINIEKRVIVAPNGSVSAVDWAGTINLIPRANTLIASLGLFEDRFGSQKNFFIGKREEKEAPLLEDRSYEGGRPTLSREGESGASFKIPHFPVDDFILPNDVDGLFDLVDFQAGSELLSVAKVRDRKIRKLRAAHDVTHEFARAYALTTGGVYAPNGTLKTTYGDTINVYNEWGITRGTHALRTGAGVDPQESVEELVNMLQDASFSGDPIDGYVVLASPELFNAVVRNDYIREIYREALLEGRQSLLVGQLPAATLGNQGALARQFSYGGVVFLEVRGGVAGQRYIPAGEGVALPIMRGLGRMHFAPPNLFSTINKESAASYLWERMSERGDKITLESETNVAAVLDRPDLVMTVTIDSAPATP